MKLKPLKKELILWGDVMKNRDFKMRERYEQKEYYPDKDGLTRIERIKEKQLCRQQKEEKEMFFKQTQEEFIKRIYDFINKEV